MTVRSHAGLDVPVCLAVRGRSALPAAVTAQTAEPPAPRPVRKVVVQQPTARLAADLVPAVAIESILAWLDAGCPRPERTADAIGVVLGSIIDSISRVERTDDS